MADDSVATAEVPEYVVMDVSTNPEVAAHPEAEGTIRTAVKLDDCSPAPDNVTVAPVDPASNVPGENEVTDGTKNCVALTSCHAVSYSAHTM